MRIILTAALGLLSLSSFAQPIDTARTWVVNGDFEQWEGKSKLKRAGGIQYAKGWSSPTSKKAVSYTHLTLPTNREV